jgi:hypothetical protein
MSAETVDTRDSEIVKLLKLRWCHTQTHTQSSARIQHKHTYTNTHTHTHIPTSTQTHTHTPLLAHTNTHSRQGVMVIICLFCYLFQIHKVSPFTVQKSIPSAFCTFSKNRLQTNLRVTDLVTNLGTKYCGSALISTI